MRIMHFARKARLPIDREIFLSLLTGLESGVATTTAIVIGLVISERSKSFIITAAFLTILVQAFNAAASRYNNLRTSEELDDQTESGRLRPFINALMQFIAHILSSVVPILPIYIVTGASMIAASTLMTGVAVLLLIGLAQGIFLKIQAKENLLEILTSGLMVMLVGSLAGVVLLTLSTETRFNL